MKKIYMAAIVAISMTSVGHAQGFLKKGKDLIGQSQGSGTSNPFSKEEAAKAIKEALVNGTNKGTETVSKEDGYFKNPAIKIPFPEDAKKIEDKLRAVGAGKQVDEAILTINRAAEKAAIEAKPIFVEAVKSLTVTDAINIVKGEENAATDYLNKSTNASLYEKFKPIISKSLDETTATKHWETIMSKYNKIPMVKKMNPDLQDYVTKMAIEGLFTMIAEEEKKIRDNPQARTTDLLKKVFGN